VEKFEIYIEYEINIFLYLKVSKKIKERY